MVELLVQVDSLGPHRWAGVPTSQSSQNLIGSKKLGPFGSPNNIVAERSEKSHSVMPSFGDLASKSQRGEPSDLPVQRPTKYDFVINLKAAKTLGLVVPPNLLVTAAEVIE
jgi:hypothetical protein